MLFLLSFPPLFPLFPPHPFDEGDHQDDTEVLAETTMESISIAHAAEAPPEERAPHCWVDHGHDTGC